MKKYIPTHHPRPHILPTPKKQQQRNKSINDKIGYSKN